MSVFAGKPFVSYVSGEENDYGRTDIRVLVAGDSNVHRLKVACPPSTRINFLPVSGAKYVSDQKGFRKLLRQELVSGCYDCLYLHLGSNDVSCRDHEFYRCVTEILDMIVDVCPSINIVLCEILPRNYDARRFPRWPLTGQQLSRFSQWINRANNMIWDISRHVPNVRYMGCGQTQEKSLYLSPDGLHLSVDGARRCLASIIEHLPVQTCVEPEVQLDAVEWPALSATELPVPPQDSTKALFSDVLQTVLEEAFLEELEVMQVPIKIDLNNPTRANVTRESKRFARRTRKLVRRYGKKFAKKCHLSDQEQVLQIKDLYRRRLVYIAQCLENDRTMDVLPQVQEILINLLQLSSFVSVDDSMILIEEALQTLLNDQQNAQQNTENLNSSSENKYDIPRETLEMLIFNGMKVKQIAELLNVSKRTVERRMHEHKLTIQQTYSQISDEELVHEVCKLNHEHPIVGYRTIQSLLQTKGLRIQEYRVRKCVRECDPCGVMFRRVFLQTSRVCRRTYSVCGPQALWHIDGNHKLIRWRLVIHGGIDGYSRLPIFLKVNNNNRADTVLCAFVEAVHEFGLPQRVRSDKGGENVKVAEFMLQHQTGVPRPFIAGRSVHNQRIERLWREIWNGCTSLYYSLFYNMEDEGILDVSNELHIMLLHLVFLPRIQSHLDRFAEALRRRPLRTENNNTPLQLWITGPRNYSSDHDQGNMDAYSIDFEPDQIYVHPESVMVPEVIPFPGEALQQIQHILDKESDFFGTDIYREALEYMHTINLNL